MGKLLERTGTRGDQADAARLAVTLEELGLGEVLRQEATEDVVYMLAGLPKVVGGGVEHGGVRESLRHGCRRAENREHEKESSETSGERTW